MDESSVINANRGAKLIEEAMKDEEADITSRDFSYKTNPIKWISESVTYDPAGAGGVGGENGSSVEILAKTNKNSQKVTQKWPKSTQK